ncbi:MAG: hypothetical protein IJM44_03765 [Ruminococcus sp.]|nr:hypothetical protein [Ruminococcus sp.]
MILKKLAAVAAAFVLISAPAASGHRGTGAPAGFVTAYADYEEPDGEVIALSAKAADEDEEEADEDAPAKSKSEKADFNPVMSLIISLIIGLIAAFIAVGSMKSKLKTVRSKTGASDYKKKDSFKLDEKTDTFLYKKLEKTVKAQPNRK